LWREKNKRAKSFGGNFFNGNEMENEHLMEDGMERKAQGKGLLIPRRIKGC